MNQYSNCKREQEKEFPRQCGDCQRTNNRSGFVTRLSGSLVGSHIVYSKLCEFDSVDIAALPQDKWA